MHWSYATQMKIKNEDHALLQASFWVELYFRRFVVLPAMSRQPYFELGKECQAIHYALQKAL